MSWDTEIVRPEVGVRFYVQIQGLPWIFLDGAAPVGPDGSTWTAPTSSGHNYVPLAYTLDTSKGLTDPGTQWERAKGTTSPGALSITLADDRAGTLLTSVFSRDSAPTAILASDVLYDVGAFTGVFETTGLTGWPATGYVYFGRETCYFPNSGATDLGTGGSPVVRDLFSLGQCDSTYAHDSDLPSTAPRIISTVPQVWYGRYVRVFAYLVGAGGVAYDSSYGVGTYTREVYRGVIQADPLVAQDWHSWTINTRSIDTILASQVGGPTRTGYLLANPIAHPGGYGGSAWAAHWISDSRRFLDITIESWTGGTLTGAPDTQETYAMEVFANSGMVTSQDIVDSVNSVIDTDLHPDYVSASVQTLTIRLVAGQNSQVVSLWQFLANTFGGGIAFRLTFHFSKANSIGHLLGLSADVTTTIEAGGTETIFQFPVDTGSTGVGGVAATLGVISPEDIYIPFFLAQDTGDDPDPPAAGYVIIGGTEVVYYSGIDSTQSAVADGVQVLTGCLRGQLGTTAIEHVIPFQKDPNASEEIDSGKLEFCVAWDHESLFDVIRQLAVSTGESAHYGSLDVLPYQWGLGLSPAHIDNAAFEAARDTTPTQQHHIRMLLRKPVKLLDVIGEWLAPLGYFLTSGVTSSGEYKITLGKVTPALESEGTVAIDASTLDGRNLPKWTDRTKQISNQIVAHFRWDLMAEAPTQDSITVTDKGSKEMYGVLNKVEWKLRGFPLTDPTEATLRVLQWAGPHWARVAHPYQTVELTTDRTGWLVKPGDTITVSIPSAPTTTGVRGIVDRLMVVLAVKRTLWGGRTGQALGARITCVDEPYTRHSTYSPSAKVASRSGSDLTLTTNFYTVDGADVGHFEVGDEIFVFERGDISVGVSTTITAIVGDVITVSGGVSSYSVTDQTRIIPQGYASCQETQMVHAFVADSSGIPVLSVADATSFKLV